MRRDSMVQFDGYLRKQGISYKDHSKSMVALSDIDKMEFVTHYNWDIPIEELIDFEKRNLEWPMSIGAIETIEKIQKKIAYLESLKLAQGVA